MLALQIEEVKDFMGKLLSKEVFDNFLLIELDVVTATSIHIAGHRQKAWYDDDEWEDLAEQDFATWREIRPVAFDLIKGKKVPLKLAGVFRLSEENTARILRRGGFTFDTDMVGGLFFNLRYENSTVILTTGVSMNSFTLDRSLERQWDADFSDFLRRNDIIFTQQ